MPNNTDIGLVNRILAGDRRAFGEVVDKYQKVVFNLAYRVTGNEQDAEDIAQTVFLKVYENLNRYNPEYQFFSLMYRIAVNESVNKKNRKRHTVELPDDMFSVGGSPHDKIVATDTEDHVGEAMMSLTPENRAIVLLRHYQEFSYREIAYIMALPAPKVKSRLYSARQRLGKILIRKGLKTEL